MDEEQGVARNISSLRLGDHLCCIYDDDAQLREITLHYLSDGIAQGLKVYYLYNTYPPDTLLHDLQGTGVDGAAAVSRGQMVLKDAVEYYTSAGAFDPLNMLRSAQALTQQALAEGYPGLRWAGDMSWSAQHPPLTDRLVEYEARINDLQSRSQATILCQYDRRRFDPTLLIDILLTHPKVAVGPYIYDNFYYLPPEAHLRQDRGAARLNQWLSTLADRQHMLWHLEHANLDLEKRFGEQQVTLDHAHQQLHQEMSQRQGAEQALRETENRYQKIFDAATDAIFILSKDARIIEVNRTACEFYGYSREEMIGLQPAIINIPEMRPAFASRFAYLREHDDPVTAETIHQTRDGLPFPVEINARRIQYEGGHAILGIIRDITERKQAEQKLIDAYNTLQKTNAALVESEAKFRSLIETSPDGITLLDENGILVDVNASEEAITGLPAKKMLGRSMADLYYNLLPERLRTQQIYEEIEQRILDACKTGSSPWLKQVWEREVLRPDAETRFIQGVSFAIPTGRGFMIGTINRDITSHRKADLELETYRHTLEAMVERRTDELQREIQERQQMEEALVEVNAALARANTDLGESEERYRLLVTQSPVSIMVIQQNHFVFVNPAGASRLGYQDANQMVGRRVLDVVAPGSRVRMAEWMQKMDTAETKEPVLVEFQSREGQTFLFESSSVPIVYQGKPAALVIGQDITERMRYEQQLEASLSEKEVMLREIHHRVKNNLNVIIALIDLQKSKQTDPQVLQLFKDLQTRAYSMSLVHESLYRSPNLAQVDFSGYLHTLIEHLYAAYQTTSNHVGVRVEVENIALRIESAIPCGLIVNELVTNALKYAFPPAFTPPGGQSKQILIRLEQSQDAEDRPLCLTVQDNGVGLPPGLDWHSIPTLGLQLVQVLAQQLDGQIRVENAGGVAWQIRFKQRR